MSFLSNEGSRVPTPEPPPRPQADQSDPPSRQAVNQMILGLGKAYVSTQRIEDGSADESTPLLPQPVTIEDIGKTRAGVWAALTTVFAASLVILLIFPQVLPDALAPLVGECPAPCSCVNQITWW